MINRRLFAQGLISLPPAGLLTGSALARLQAPTHVEPPTLLWELFALLPTQSDGGEPIRLTGTRGEMIFPGTLRSTPGIPPGQVEPIISADSRHLINFEPLPGDEGLTRFIGAGMESIDAIATFKPCIILIGDFSGNDVHKAWDSMGYAPTDDPDIWSYKGLTDPADIAGVADELLLMQRRLTLPPRSQGRYQFLTCLDDRYIVEAESIDLLRQIRNIHAGRPDAPTSLADSLGSVPATIGHVAAMYEDDRFVSLRGADGATERQSTLQEENESILASIEQELGRMPPVQTALLGVTPGTPWREPLSPASLPDIASGSMARIRLQNAEDAERYLTIAEARFDSLVSPYTETPYAELFTFEGSASGSQVSIDLRHVRSARYDILQMAYFNDLTFLTWEPDGLDTWRTPR